MHFQRKQMGFTLIELMIALVIGSIVTASGLTLYVQTSKTRNLIQAELALQNDAYFIQQTLRQFINQAGFRPLEGAVDSLLIPVKTLSDSFSSDLTTWSAGQYIDVSANKISIRFEGVSDADGNADGSVVNCQGESIAAAEIEVVEFSIVDNGLVCTSDSVEVELVGKNSDVIVENNAMYWGVDTNNDRSVDEYRSATSTIASDESVLSFRVSLLLASAMDVYSARDLSYSFDGTSYTPTDTKLRRELVTTVQLKH